MGKKGFTLIELLVVIAIIALLMAILTPVLSVAREQARKGACLSNQHQIMVAAQVYMADNNAKFMFQDAGVAFAQTHALTTASGPNWIRSLWPYVAKAKKILRCPSNKWRHQDQGDTENAWYPSEDETFSYVANGILTHFGGMNAHPSLVIATSDDYDTSNGSILRPHFVGFKPSLSEEGWVGWMRYDNGYLLTSWPHKGRVHGYLDGHAEWNTEWEITSRRYGLLIGGEDTFEPDLPGYANAARWGRVIPSLARR
jgi:prepilin-type N-terminal cleavage/methylation domain-containing protein